MESPGKGGGTHLICIICAESVIHTLRIFVQYVGTSLGSDDKSVRTCLASQGAASVNASRT